MNTIKHIDPLSLAKVCGVVYGAIGIIIGIFISLLTLAGMVDLSLPTGEEVGKGIVVILSLTLFPIVQALLGFTVGAAVAFIFNKTVRFSGGIKCTIDK